MDSVKLIELSPGILELHECERWTTPVLQINEDNLAVLVKQVLHVLAADVRRQVAHVDPALLATTARHSASFISEKEI